MPSPKLSLYHFRSCPFCRRVQSVVDELGIDVEDQDIQRDPKAYKQLEEARGSTTVPVLRIEQEDGSVTWMPESRDIMAYLRKNFD